MGKRIITAIACAAIIGFAYLVGWAVHTVSKDTQRQGSVQRRQAVLERELAASQKREIADRRARTLASAESQLQTCQQIETINGQIRAVIRESSAGVRQLPEPRRSQAEAQVKAALHRFAKRDCYALPIVRAVGLRPPQKRR